MIARRPRPQRRPLRRDPGFILLTGLLFLVILTILGVAMFRGSGLMDRVSANAREKERAFESAQSALQYAEWWLDKDPAAGTGDQGTPCNGLVDGNNLANVHVCSTPLPSTYATTAWTNGFEYKTPTQTINSGGGLAATGVDVNYFKKSGFYIEWLGASYDGKDQFYQVTAYGYGGNSDTVSIVRSVYKIAGKSGDLTV